MTAVEAENSQQCHKYFLQYSTFASERPQVRTWGRQTCFLALAPSNLVTSLRQPTARMPHLSRQAISKGTEKLNVLHVDFDRIDTEGILTLTCIKIRILLAH